MFVVKKPVNLLAFKRTSVRCRPIHLLSDFFRATFSRYSIAPTLFPPVNVAPPRRNPDLLKRTSGDKASSEQAHDDENLVGQRAVASTFVQHAAT